MILSVCLTSLNQFVLFLLDPRQPTSLDISQRNLLAVGFGSHVTVWKDAIATKIQSPYLRHDVPGNAVDTVRFRPYEDVLGLGHKSGYVSMGKWEVITLNRGWDVD